MMLAYILKRILIFIPTLLLITLLGFILSINAPTDPLDLLFTPSSPNTQLTANNDNEAALKKQWRKKLGLDLPVFYISLGSFSRPDTLYKITGKQERECLDRLVSEHGNWYEIQQYMQSIDQFCGLLHLYAADTASCLQQDAKGMKDGINRLHTELLALKTAYKENSITGRLKAIRTLVAAPAFLNPFQAAFLRIQNNYENMIQERTPWKNYIPVIYVYRQNQYHRWLFGDGVYARGLVRGDFGISYLTRQPVSDVIVSKTGWSMLFALLSIVLCYAVSIPLGVKSAVKKHSGFDKNTGLFLFLLYSIPSFWLAMLLLMTFANPDVLHWFPASGVKPVQGYPQDSNFVDKLKLSLPYVVLPTICYTYGAIAFLSRITRASMIDVLKQDYIYTARAKGLTDNKVVWKHGLRNALLPLITIFANVFPAIIGGSVILENIFAIPGMGFETLAAVQSGNYPMIIAILTITSFLTLLGFLISDILYVLADPRISYK